MDHLNSDEKIYDFYFIYFFVNFFVIYIFDILKLFFIYLYFCLLINYGIIKNIKNAINYS